MRTKCIFAVLLIAFSLAGCAKSKKVDLVVESGKEVSFHYTLYVDGKVVESSIGKPPLMYKHGSQQIIAGLQKGLLGLRVGDKKSVIVAPDEGYGNPNPEAIKEAPRSSLPANSKPEVGMFVEVSSKDGRRFRAMVTEVKKDTITLDFNHPLSGKTLKFDIEIVSID